jgi:hypothetical protein
VGDPQVADQKDENMGRVFGFITRVTATAVFLLLANSTPSAPHTAPVGPAVASSAYLFPEARLRKVHLVRPDLLPYPIVYAVYC